MEWKDLSNLYRNDSGVEKKFFCEILLGKILCINWDENMEKPSSHLQYWLAGEDKCQAKDQCKDNYSMADIIKISRQFKYGESPL